MNPLQSVIIEHEGVRLKPYRDTKGVLTIGVGRNLDDCGISEDEAMFLLNNDLTTCETQLSRYDWYVGLDKVRQGVIIELVFNVGLPKALQFKNMIIAIINENWACASNELLDSAWAKQVGSTRSENMASRLLRGKYP